MKMLFEFEILRFQELPSTNTYTLEQAAQGASEGLVVQASYQSAGRGKPGRGWVSPAGKNLLFSVLLRPPVSPAKAPMLTQIAARAVAAALGKHKIKAEFKKPNDLMVGGKKICGILSESVSGSEKIEYAVVGIGLNVNSTGPDLPPEAVSMKDLLKKETSLDGLMQDILSELRKALESFYADRS